jgi:hypothetical protein
MKNRWLALLIPVGAPGSHRRDSAGESDQDIALKCITALFARAIGYTLRTIDDRRIKASKAPIFSRF